MASLKVAELRSILDAFAQALEANKADIAAVCGLRDLCAMFSGSEAKTVAAFLKAIEQVASSASTQGSPRIASIEPVLSSLRALVNGVAKKDLIKSLDSLLDTLRKNADVPIPLFVANAASALAPKVKDESKRKGNSKKGAAPVDDHLVDDYVKRLEAALGDDAKFEPLLEELKADHRVAQAEVVVIASRFYGRTAKSTSRPKALERIRERHVKLMKFKRQPSTSGRPAA
jgi:hypothetical protein